MLCCQVVPVGLPELVDFASLGLPAFLRRQKPILKTNLNIFIALTSYYESYCVTAKILAISHVSNITAIRN